MSLSEQEEKWVEKIFDADFKQKDILLEQISKAKIVYEQGYDYISIKFIVDKKVEKYPYQVRVPVQMRAFKKNTTPIVFLLHVINGIVDELELITADSSEISLKNIELNDVKYEIDASVVS